MIIELILASIICQSKTPPVAPVDAVQVVIIDNTKVVNDQNNKIAALEQAVENLKKTPCPHCKKLATDQPSKKFSMSDKTGRTWENDNYERLVHDINLINRYGSLDPPIKENKPIPYTASPIVPQALGNCVGGSCDLPQRGFRMSGG